MIDILHAGAYRLPLSRTLVMGILNLTPDSFSDGGRHADLTAALRHARRLLDEGADLLDIGGESTRPGAALVDAAEEWQRVLPVLRELQNWQVPVSLDTRKPEVMRMALSYGIAMINDIAAMETPGALAALQDSDAAVCLMHKRGEPQTMQQAPQYDDVVAEVADYLATRRLKVLAAGIESARIVLDPGFGFGKDDVHNIALFRALPRLSSLGSPLLVGLSRKALLGRLLGGRPAVERDAASVAAAVMATSRGAAIVRVHAVRDTVDALKVGASLK